MLDNDRMMATLADRMNRRIRDVSPNMSTIIGTSSDVGIRPPPLPDEDVAHRLRTFEDTAAVTGRFDPHDLFTIADGVNLRQTVLARALGDFVVETSHGELRWLMRPTARAETLRGFVEANELNVLLKQPLPKTDAYGKLLREVLNKQSHLSLKGQSPDALRHLRSIVEDLKDIGLATPDAAEINRLLDAGAFAREFLTVDKLFVGRTAELASLRKFLSRPPDPNKYWPRWSALVVSGLGGSGKSALLARFLREVHRDKAATLVIFDFDRPGIDAGDTVWLRTEMARQIGLQYPDISETLRQARRTTREVQALVRQSASRLEKQSHDRSSDDLLYQIRDALTSVGAGNRPMLIVLDTLEVLSTSEAQSSLLSWIDTISDIFSAQLKVLFSGRLFDSSLAVFQARAGDESMQLDALPVAAARTLLRKSGVSEGLADALARSNWLPRRPLELRLLARLATDNRISAASLERDLQKGSKELSAGIIYRRVLARLGEGVIGQLASPGLILRFVTPALIREVLVPALGLSPMTDVEAKAAFDQLAKHSWLVTREDDNTVRHRRDLRRSMLKLMIEDNPELAKQISDKAVKYFEDGQAPNPAEPTYHKLLWVVNPDDGAELPLAELKEAYPSIAPDIEDLPPAGAALLRFASLKGVPASDVELLPSDYFLRAYDKTGQRLVRSREFGQGLRFLERKEVVLATHSKLSTVTTSFEWERDTLFATANWERLVALRRGDIALPAALIKSDRYDSLAKEFFQDAVLGLMPTELIRDKAPAVLNQFAAAIGSSKRREIGIGASAVGLLTTGFLMANSSKALNTSSRLMFTKLVELSDRLKLKSRSSLLEHRLLLVRLSIASPVQNFISISPSLLPLRPDLLIRLGNIEALAPVEGLLSNLTAALENPSRRKSLTSRNVLSTADALYKHDDLWKAGKVTIGQDIDSARLRGPDIEFRDPVRFCLLEEFNHDAGRRDLAGIMQAQIDMPLADLEPEAFAEALTLDAEHALESPVELVDRSWRLGSLLDSVAAARPNSNRVRWVREAYQRWDHAVTAALQPGN